MLIGEKYHFKTINILSKSNLHILSKDLSIRSYYKILCLNSTCYNFGLGPSSLVVLKYQLSLKT